MASLVIERGPDSGKRIHLDEFPVTIGRDRKNTVMLRDHETSRHHLRIKKRGNLYILEDLESMNGTFINGDRVINSTLKNGDKILLGTSEIIFHTSAQTINLSSEFLNFEAQPNIQNELGPAIHIHELEQKNHFDASRFDPSTVANALIRDTSAIRDIFHHHSNVLVTDNLSEASRTLLKSVGNLMPKATRAAIFMWSEASRQLVPFGSRNYGPPAPFFLNQNALEDSISRKQGIILKAVKQKSSSCHRLILPMIHNDHVIAIIHIEYHQEKSIPPREIELAQTLLNRCSATFETMLLRQSLDAWLVGMIETLIATVEAKDTYTRGHSERVSRYAMVIGEELKLKRDVKKLLLISSLCHDIGKIGIPDSILKKASLLSAEEYAEMKLHPTIGADIISHIPNAKRILSGVKYHHEKWDGTGYPEALAGEEIPFFGRIVAIADVFDAMVSGRSYSGFVDQNDAIERLTKEKELFDPEILKAFINAHENGSLSLKNSTQNNIILSESETSDTFEELKTKNEKIKK